MKTYYLDIGNSYLKLAERKETGWAILCQNHTASTDMILDCIPEEAGDFRIITSSVRSQITGALEKQLQPGRLITITTEQIPDTSLDYDTPHTLGIDRFLACLGASAETGRDVVVVDAGTACTIDLMTSDKVYRGGVIMPGLKVYHQAVETFIPELPKIPREIPDNWPGKSTAESMQWGVNGTFFQSVAFFIEKHLKEAGEAYIFITGGDGPVLKKYLENSSMQVNSRPFLVFEGMRVFSESSR